MAAVNSQYESYLQRYQQDFSLSDREIEQRINQTLYQDSHPSQPSSNWSFSSASSYRVSAAPAAPVVPEMTEEKLAELKKVWDTYPRIEQPKDIMNVTLFPHQLVTVYKMEELERIRRVKSNISEQTYLTDFGILGDIPGYGKSYSVVTLILRDNMPWDISKEHEKSDIHTYNSCLKVISRTMKKRVKANLLLASPTLIEQWKEYFRADKNNKLKIKDISTKKDLDSKFDPNEWDVVLVSSTRYNELISHVGTNVVWRRFIFDEAGSTHISSMAHTSAGFVWFISATYQQLLFLAGSHSHYMRSFFGNIHQQVLAHFVIKNPIEFVKNSFRMPKVIEKTHVCLNPRVLNVLSSYIDTDARLMISAGDIRGAIAHLGGGSTESSNLFEIVSKKQKEKLEQAKFHLNFWKNRPNSERDIETWEKKVAEIEKTIKELEEKYNTVLEDDCNICYSPIENPVLMPCCQNVFCGGCIIKWMETSKNTCPMCRSAIKTKELVYINKEDDKKEEKKEEVKEDKPMQKHETVLNIVEQGLANKKKFLIFSMFDESFSIIRRGLVDHNIDFVEISGSKATRDLKLKKFREGKVNVVFLNSRFNGAGINLETASDIILYHEMPSAIREQVVGRALRIGREGDLIVHNLVY